MEINDSSKFPAWAFMHMEENKLIAKEVLQPELPTSEDNFATLHNANYDKDTEKLQIGRVKVRGKRILEDHNIVVDTKLLGLAGALECTK